ncbi:MAG: hypothetical protein NUV72_06825, partial [Bauldia sp.]|nr:hypothetical protein [Bauldia sp.]
MAPPSALLQKIEKPQAARPRIAEARGLSYGRPAERRQESPVKSLTLILAMLATGFLAACTGGDGRYIETAGGGFVFNYRLAIAFAGVVVVPLKPLPEKSTIEVTMEDPAGGPPITMR